MTESPTLPPLLLQQRMSHVGDEHVGIVSPHTVTRHHQRAEGHAGVADGRVVFLLLGGLVLLQDGLGRSVLGSVRRCVRIRNTDVKRRSRLQLKAIDSRQLIAYSVCLCFACVRA